MSNGTAIGVILGASLACHVLDEPNVEIERMPKVKEPSIPERFKALVVADLDAYLDDPTLADAAIVDGELQVPAETLDNAKRILSGTGMTSYRDGLIIQLGSGLLIAEDYDHTERAPSGRSSAQVLGFVTAERHIAAVRDAYQNIGKNVATLTRGNVLPFDDILRWANGAPEEQRRALFDYVVAAVSKTARAVLPMPSIDRAALTFSAMAALVHDLVTIPSGGAYQQYAVASCLHAIIDEFGQGGVGGLRIETKRLNATDASSKTAGDVQVVRGNRVEEAFEVTANDWRTKIEPALQSARSADLARVHIIASVDDGFLADLALLRHPSTDLTVIDVEAYLRTLVAVMRKPAREAALLRLYEFLDRLQPEIERTNEFVRLLGRHGLTEAAGGAPAKLVSQSAADDAG